MSLAPIKRLTVAFIAAAVFWPAVLPAEPVAVRYSEGVMHGFLVLRSLDDKILADGDLIQTVRGNRVTARVVFHFKDGSVHDETAVYSQKGQFQLVTDHLVQKGPTFPQPLEMSIDGASGNVSVHYTDERGKQQTETAHMDIPPDLANGMILKLLLNVKPDSAPNSVSLIGATPKPRLVKLVITTAGLDRFSIGGSSRQAIHYVLKPEIGGVAGVVAPLIGKQPPDAHVWILGGEVPAFVKSEQSLYVGGPVWRIELATPAWPRAPSPKRTANSAK